MADIAARDLRNDVSAVLRRVEAGEHLRITVSGRPVAQLLPLSRRPTTMPWTTFEHGLEGARADAGLAKQIRELVPDTTDDAPLQ
jgi:prevent-host-death family protein